LLFAGISYKNKQYLASRVSQSTVRVPQKVLSKKNGAVNQKSWVGLNNMDGKADKDSILQC